MAPWGTLHPQNEPSLTMRGDSSASYMLIGLSSFASMTSPRQSPVTLCVALSNLCAQT